MLKVNIQELDCIIDARNVADPEDITETLVCVGCV